MTYSEISFSGHAVRRMFQQRIAVGEVVEVIQQGEVIQEYPEDRPFPSQLMLRFVKGRPLHVVSALDPSSRICYVITAYWPDQDLWNDDYRNRKKR
ncbi:MAG: DUF4258 domain-containing protein [Acidimicrobiia bacterium]|nr:DUF4258 domain-containing protein [Acidimicrobiia bacterium]